MGRRTKKATTSLRPARDLVMATAAYTLARLTEARQPDTESQKVPMGRHTAQAH